MDKEIVIIGGGIAGLAIALGLKNKGISCKVFESASELKPVGAGIALAFNAVKACRILGIEEQIKSSGRSIDKAWITNPKGEILSAMDYKKYIQLFQEVSVVIHRHELHKILLSQLGQDSVFLGKKVINFTQLKDKVEIFFQDGEKLISDYVVASDGVHSVFRRELVHESAPRYSGYTCWRGIGRLPEGYPYGDVVLESWGRGLRLGIVVLKDQKVYWYVVKNAPANDHSLRTMDLEKILALFKGWNNQYLEVINHTDPGNVILNDIIDIAPLKKFAFNNIVLTGDAAHATTPNIGQGGCQALEDAVVLSNLISENPNNYTKAFHEFENKRVARAAKVIITSKRIGNLAHLENPLLTSVRDFFMKITPENIAIRQLKWLTKTPF